MNNKIVHPMLYIVGPMTGLPEYNHPAFFEAEEKLREKGYLVANPASIVKHPPYLTDEDEVWRYCMRRAIPLLVESDQIACLPGWQDSRGSKLEVFIAQNLGMPTWDYRDGVLHEPGTTPPLDALGALPAPMPAGGVVGA